jgi:hypothetical protein
MKNGMANSAKLSNPVAMRCAKVVTAVKEGMVNISVNIDDRPIQ